MLSNLGNVTEPPTFGTLTPTRMWFSTSAHMPRGLSVGAITVGGRLQLCFRYRNALFHLLTAETSCYRYWGTGIWTDYGTELCRRVSEIVTDDQ